MSSLKEAYEALRSLQILGIGENLDISASTCASIGETLKSSSGNLKDVNFALKANQILKCSVDVENFKVLIFHLLKNCFGIILHNLYCSLLLIFIVPSLFKAASVRLRAAIADASSLLDFYYSVGGLLLVKVTIQHSVFFNL